MNNLKKIFKFLILIVATFAIITLCSCETETNSNTNNKTEYIITYDPNGGIVEDNKQVVSVKDEVTLATPTREGYKFIGWFVGEMELKAETCDIQEDITLVAKWVENTYSIDYDLDGGVVKDNPRTYSISSDNITLNIPQKVGYTFLGWSGTNIEELEKNVTIDSSLLINRTYKANWQANEYTITYDANGGIIDATTQEIAYDAEITLPVPEKEGYTFTGWYNGEIEWDSGVWKTLGDVTLTAKWTAKTYVIKYNPNGGNIKATSQRAVYNQNVTLFIPTKTGYAFVGWFVDEKEYTSGMWRIANNVTLTAKWEVAEYTITYNANGGVVENETQAVAYGSKYELQQPQEREGYTFLGWFYGANKQNSGVWRIASDITLQARWEAKTYVVTFLINDGNVDKQTRKVSYGSQFNLIDFTKTGYTLLGWFEGTKEYTSGIWETDRDVTLIPKWQVNTYIITYEADGGNINQTKQEAQFDSNVELVEPIKKGYKFLGWYNKATIYTSGVWKTAKDITLTAKWEIIIYSINYVLNGGNEINNPTNYNVDCQDIMLVNPTKTGYTFMGWSGTGIESKEMRVVIPSGTIGNKSFVANWQVNSYTITYDANGGYVDLSTQQVTYNSDVTLPIPTREGYMFLRWLEGSVEYKSGVWKTLKDVTLSAKWDAIIYTISYNLDGENKINTTEYYTAEYDNIVLINPTKTGYTFIGWSGTGIENIEMSVVIQSGSTGDRTYTANWQANTYIITYDANGGQVDLNTQQVTYDSEVTLPVPTQEGYTFSGWFKETVQYNDGIWKTSKDVTLTAKWDAIIYTITYNLDGGSATANPLNYKVNSKNIVFVHPTKTGYTFIGWSGTGIENIEMSVVIQSGSTGDRTYTANWQVNTYIITYDANGGQVDVNTQQVTYDTDVTLSMPTREEYVFAGWYNGQTNYINGIWKTARNITLTAKWEIKKYAIVYILNGGNVIGNPELYSIFSDNITLKNPTKTGYTFLGWSGTDLIGWTLNVEINAGSRGNREYTANWKANTYTITYDANGGHVDLNAQQVTYDSNEILQTPIREGYTFVGWYDNNVKYASGVCKITNDVTLTAVWLDNDSIYSPEIVNGNLIITYGKYPQTIKDDSVTVASTMLANGYYQGSDGAYYAKVTASTRYSNYTYSNGETIVNGNVYYFKVEPIKWRVLYNRDGTYMVISDLILDSQCYYKSTSSRNGATDYQGNSTTSKVYANNYKYSDIRTFLNTTFLNKAFSSIEQNKIHTTEVDNSVSSTGYDTNKYACGNTQDKIFLLSYKEATNVDYGFSSDDNSSKTRYAKGTDYAKARGLSVYTSSGNNYTGNATWWMRSPISKYDFVALCVDYDGNIYYGNDDVNTGSLGVRPALNINL